jgi:anti-sigma factor RsiW
MMDCAEVGRFLHAYIDHEFEGRERIEFEYHLSQCESCRNEVAYYTALRSKVRDDVKRDIPPLRLQRAISHMLEEETQPTFGWFSWSLATAGAFLCALGVLFWTPPVEDKVPALSSSPLTRVVTPQSVSTSPIAPVGLQKRTPIVRHVGTVSASALSKTLPMLPTQTQQRCEDEQSSRSFSRHQGGWFFSQNQQGRTKYLKRHKNALDDTLCDPPRRNLLIRANHP